MLNEGQDEWGIGLPPGLDLVPGAGQRLTVEEHDDLSLVEAQLRAMRRWMTDNGYADQPLWITEYGILLTPDLGYTPARAAAYLTDSFTLFNELRDADLGLFNDDHRLVQRWVWYSSRSTEFPVGNLFDGAGQPTVVMAAMQEFLRAAAE